MLKTATTGTGKDQYTAIDDLGERHKSASTVVPALAKLLTSDDAQVRWRTARTLGDYRAKAIATAPALRALLADKDLTVQTHAAIALGKIGDTSDETVAALVKSATTPDPRIARAAIAALGELKPGPERVTAALDSALASDDQAVAVHALEAIVERGADAVPLLKAALARPKTAYLACAAIEQIGPPAADAVPAIVAMLDTTKHSQLQIQGLLAIAAVGPAAKSASPQIIPLLGHATDATVPVAAAFALGSIGAADADAQLKQALTKNGNPFLQMIAAWSLAKIHPQDEALVKQAVEKLTQGLANKDDEIRTAAARALEMLKAPPELVAPALMTAANDPDPEAATNVANALASLGEKVIPKATEALQKTEYRSLAAKVLERLGPKASSAVEPIINAIKGADAGFRTELQMTLGAIGPAAAPATEQLVEGLASNDAGVRESSLYALRAIGPGAKAAVPALFAKALSGDSFESLAAAWAVSSIAPTDSDAATKLVPLLSHGLKDPSEQNRAESAAALGEFGAASKPAVGILTYAANEDGSTAVRDAAAEALKRINAAP